MNYSKLPRASRAGEDKTSVLQSTYINSLGESVATRDGVPVAVRRWTGSEFVWVPVYGDES